MDQPFLVKNEFPLRGDCDSEESKEFGLFNSLFKYTSEKDKIIHLIADMLRKNIVSELNDSSYLTLLADGTTDRNEIEMLSIAFRYIRNGVPVETLVAIEATNDISAMGLKNTIINTIETLGINGEKKINQCYDGANVMSGSRGGVQKLVEEYYNIHCFNHKLHLVVGAVVLDIDACRLIFGEVRLLHNFFSRFKVCREYSPFKHDGLAIYTLFNLSTKITKK